MSEYKDETLLTDEEIAAAIAEAKRAKAEKLRAEKEKSLKLDKQKTPEPEEEKASEEAAFSDSESASEEEENLSPKMKSARSFSNAFAAARNKREEELKRKRKAAVEEQEVIEEETASADDYDEETEEPVYFDADDESEEYEEYGEEEAAEFEVDGEEEYDEYADDEDADADGIFEVDEEESSGYGERVPVSEYEDEDDDEEDDDDDEDDEDDDDESTFSTKTKVILGIIIAVLVLAIVAAGFFFLTKGGSGNSDPAVSSVSGETDVKAIKFSEPSMSLRVGESKPLQIVIEPETAEDKVLSLKSADSSIAKVDGSGNVTGVASGSTTITATLKSNETITASLVVNVIDEKQNAINVYNKFINSILDGSTDLDASDTDSEAVEDSESDTEGGSDSDTDSEASTAPKSKTVLTGSIIRDLNSDDDLELALYYTNPDEGSSVRIFYLADENAAEEEEPEPMYDEYGNLIETDTDTAEADSDTATDSDGAPAEKAITELDIYSEMYSVCYNTLENDATGWDTCYVEIKEEEVSKARVTILSEDYTSPTYVYETSDDSIATVDNQGNIKGVKPGTCFITVTSPLNSDAMAMIKVRVKDDTDLLEDYLAQVPKVNATNDSVIPTETLTGKAITDIDGDGVSELLLRFSYGNNVETINMVKVENDQCVVYKTYNNLSDLYEYYEGDGSYSNSILIHYTTGKVCMEYKAVVAKTDSKTKTSEQKILSVESNGSLSELVNFTTTTDISTKTVTSEVVIEDDSDTTSIVDEDSDIWYDDTESDTYYDDSDDSGDSDFIDEDGDGIPDDDYGYGYEGSYAAYTFDDIVREGGIDFSSKIPQKRLPQSAGVPGDDDGDEDSNDNDGEDDDNTSRITSTVTSEVIEETTKYFVNGTPVEQSVYEETLSTYSARYSVWADWEFV